MIVYNLFGGVCCIPNMSWRKKGCYKKEGGVGGKTTAAKSKKHELSSGIEAPVIMQSIK